MPQLILTVVTTVALLLVGGLVGALIGFGTLQIGMLVGAFSLGPRVPRIVIGVGPRVREWKLRKRSVALRAVPVMLSVTVGPGKAPVRPRLWATSAISAVFGVTSVVLLAVFADSAFWLGTAVGAAAAVGLSLYPRRDAAVTSTGWVLAHYLRMTGGEAAEMDAAPLVAKASDAVHVGDLATAEKAADQLAAEHPDLQSATFARVIVLEAKGHYIEAMQLVVGMASAPGLEQRDFVLLMAGLAGLAASAVEAGQLDSELGLKTATQAISDAEGLNYPGHKLNGTKALIELLQGDEQKAIALVVPAISLGDDTLSRADDLATLARAHMAAGDNRKAREALSEAESLAPWWPRVAAVRARLGVS